MGVSAFISYTWDSNGHQDWVLDLGARLRADGVEARVDAWDLQPGDQLPAFMEQAVRASDHVIVVCTPKYKQRSDARKGGAGYEGDMMTAELLYKNNRRKFIPLLREGEWLEAAPSWLLGGLYIDARSNPMDETCYERLLASIRGELPGPPPVAKTPDPS